MSSFDDFGLLVGKHLTSLPSLSNEEKNELQLDDKGRLIISGRFLEDSAHVSGDSGLFILAVRNDSETSLVDTNLDYAPLQVNDKGFLKITLSDSVSPAAGTENYSVSDNLAPGGDALVSVPSTAFVDVESTPVGLGETLRIYGWQWACDKNAAARIVTDDGVDVIVYKTSLNSSAMPSYSEHWSEGGRIEVPGSTGLSVKIQIRKRVAPGGSAEASASLHSRKV